MNGAAIKRLRARLGASPVELAALLGVTQPTVYRWESFRGAVPPIGLAQRQLLLLIGLPKPPDAARIMEALRKSGVPAAWAYITSPFATVPRRGGGRS